MLHALDAWMPMIVSVCIAIVVGGLGGWLTRIGPWYRSLAKPSWQPPDWLFGPAWTVIFGFMVASSLYAWDAANGIGEASRVIVLFGVNIVLNIAWSAIFFRLERPDWAFLEVILLWLSILALVLGLWSISETASLLLMPYLAWVTFAAYLNLTIVRLNPLTARGKSEPSASLSSP